MQVIVLHTGMACNCDPSPSYPLCKHDRFPGLPPGPQVEKTSTGWACHLWSQQVPTVTTNYSNYIYSDSVAILNNIRNMEKWDVPKEGGGWGYRAPSLLDEKGV